jgi:hypothetical protein
MAFFGVLNNRLVLGNGKTFALSVALKMMMVVVAVVVMVAVVVVMVAVAVVVMVAVADMAEEAEVLVMVAEEAEALVVEAVPAVEEIGTLGVILILRKQSTTMHLMMDAAIYP